MLPLLNQNLFLELEQFSKIYAEIPRFWQNTPTCPTEISSFPSSEISGYKNLVQNTICDISGIFF